MEENQWNDEIPIDSTYRKQQLHTARHRLWKKNANGVPTPVLPIEIKRPSNIRNERQENQLMSYMRQLKLNVGLYIGEKIELYYDVSNDGEVSFVYLP